MLKTLGTLLLGSLAFAPLASAQDYRVEASGYLGWTFSKGVPIQEAVVDGEIFDRLNPTSGSSYGFSFGVFFTEKMEVEFALDRQQSALEGKGRGVTREFADMNLNNYHVNFVYNFGDDRDTLPPFIFGGLGATQAQPKDIMGSAIDSNTKFARAAPSGVEGGRAVRLAARE
jgi:hypothetical protein